MVLAGAVLAGLLIPKPSPRPPNGEGFCARGGIFCTAGLPLCAGFEPKIPPTSGTVCPPLVLVPNGFRIPEMTFGFAKLLNKSVTRFLQRAPVILSPMLPQIPIWQYLKKTKNFSCYQNQIIRRGVENLD